MFSDNSNPNLKDQAIESLAKLRQAHKIDNAGADGLVPASHRSIYTDQTYNNSAVGEMNMNELDILLEKN